MDSRAQPTVVAIDRVNGKTYKLFYYYESNSWELYCLTDDPGETKNLVQTLPKVTATLSQTVNQWLEEKSPTWRPAFPIKKTDGRSAGPPPVFQVAN